NLPRDCILQPHLWLEPQSYDGAAARLAGVDPASAARLRAVAVLRADAGFVDADGPDAAGAAEQRSQTIDGGKEVPAVLFHHREQQGATGVAAPPPRLRHL